MENPFLNQVMLILTCSKSVLNLLLAWSDFGDWSDCDVSCGVGKRHKKRACLGGRTNDEGCPGSNVESEVCDTGVECDLAYEPGGKIIT